ncbi:MAG: 50S ribosomal protein L24 [Promethearchaeota archaeon]
MKVASKKPRKQRKALFNAKNHHRSKLMTTRLADFLRDTYGIKRVPVKVGDSVRVIKGEFKNFEGTVLEVLPKRQRVKIKECVFDKADGTQFNPPIHVSNLIITKFGDEKKMDPWRVKLIQRKEGFVAEEILTTPKKKKQGKEEEYI